jgi:hypothetical protein
MEYTCRRKYLPHGVFAVFMLCVCFHWWQNHHGFVGGRISLAKSLWLATALVNLFLIPAWLWRDGSFSSLGRKRYRMFFSGYVLRAAVEMPLLLFTHQWRCWHGIAHNASMLMLLWMMRRGRNEGRYDWLLTLVLLAESLNAWMFSKAGSPQTGIYFADDSVTFARINAITWMELAILTPLVILWLRWYVKGGNRS